MATGGGGEDRIGNYKVVRVILPGQSATVMEVCQEGSGRRFVIKQLLPSKAEEKDERKAFEHEAKLGMDLSHPNLIRVLEYVPKDPGGPFFVMDYFPSQHLKLSIVQPKKYPLPRHQLHRIILQSGTALAYMHDKGWVHRDVKPENILINKAGEVRVIDYALALKVVTGMARMFAGKPKRQGTHSYMSPEQIRCEPVAPSADIYSLGITCYELAAGRKPFAANSQQELLSKHVNDRPSPPTTYHKEITKEFSDLVMKMLQKKPADRPRDMHDFLSQFKRVRIYQGDADPRDQVSAF